MFQCSRDKKGLLTLTSTMMEPIHLPELELKGVYPNQREAAQKFMGAAAQKLVSHLRHLKEEEASRPLKQLLKDMELELTAEQAAKAEGGRKLALRDKKEGEGPSAEPLETGPCRIRLKLRGTLTNEKSAIMINPPDDFAGSNGEWVRQASRRIGIDCPAPVAPTQEAADAAMLKAITRVRHELPYIREQFLKGFPGDARLSIRAALPGKKKDTKEYHWLTVTGWPEEARFQGIEENEDEAESGSAARTATEVTVELDDVFDYMLGGEKIGFLSGLYLQRVQEEYGELAHL